MIELPQKRHQGIDGEDTGDSSYPRRRQNRRIQPGEINRFVQERKRVDRCDAMAGKSRKGTKTRDRARPRIGDDERMLKLRRTFAIRKREEEIDRSRRAPRIRISILLRERERERAMMDLVLLVGEGGGRGGSDVGSEGFSWAEYFIGPIEELTLTRAKKYIYIVHLQQICLRLDF